MKEVRNGNGTKMMALLTQQGVFTTAAHCHLAVGHTHEDVDSVLALVTTAFGKADYKDFQTPQDMARILNQSLPPVFAKHGMEYQVEIIDTAPWTLTTSVLSDSCD